MQQSKKRAQNQESTASMRYDHKRVEAKWKEIWRKNNLDVAAIESAAKPFYNLMMFPYPSAEGLHVGNMYAFTGSDIYGRFKRMQRYDVFEPIGLDGFGIHSENYALKAGRHPMDQAVISEKNFYTQLQNIGAMYDWSRTLETYDSDYYRWTQWIFVQMFKHGLAYRGKAKVNWCPSCKTVLADEQVIKKTEKFRVVPREVPRGSVPEGLQEVEIAVCERCGNKVSKRLLEQWFFRITAYAGKLLKNLETLDWSEKVKTAQRNWIGEKMGINITYSVVDSDGKPVGEVTCFTTRPDTNFGATFVVLAPEHPFVTQIPKKVKPFEAKGFNLMKIRSYIEQAKNRSLEERIAEGRKKTGVFTGLYCVNQLNNYKMPVFISDFVIMDVGTGAVVGVPGHDKRDFEFAQAMRLPVRRVVASADGDSSTITRIEQVQEEEGTMVNSEFLNGLDIHEATKKMMGYMEKKGWGKRVTSFHLRDWLISRQRYWGPPIPMIFCQTCAGEKKGERRDMPGWYTVPEKDLPVLLPRIPDYKPGDDGVAPLAKHKEFYETTCPGCKGKAVRETDVSDTFLDSSWYFLRYPSVGVAEVAHENLDPSSVSLAEGSHTSNNFFPRSQSEAGQNFVGSPQRLSSTKVPLKIGNWKLKIPWDREITRRWLPVDMYTGGAEHSVLHLMYSRFVTMALADFGYLDFDEPFTRFYAHGLVIKDGAKMSKSKGNVVTPDEYINLYGVDALRLYLMFMGPFNEGGDFRDAAMEGMSRWVTRVWKLAISNIKYQISNREDQKGGNQHSHQSSAKVQTALQKLIKKVGDDIEKRRYNTAIAAMMEFTNLVADEGGVLAVEELKTFILLLAPFAPFLAEELWQAINGTEIDIVSDAYRGASFAAHPSSRLELRVTRAGGPPRRGPLVGVLGGKPEAGPAGNSLRMTVLEKTRRAASYFSSVHRQLWPTYDPKFLEEETIEVVVQVNGKLRDTCRVSRITGHDQKEVEILAREREKVKRYLEGVAIKKVIFVPGKLINFVV